MSTGSKRWTKKQFDAWLASHGGFFNQKSEMVEIDNPLYNEADEAAGLSSASAVKKTRVSRRTIEAGDGAVIVLQDLPATMVNDAEREAIRSARQPVQGEPGQTAGNIEAATAAVPRYDFIGEDGPNAQRVRQRTVGEEKPGQPSLREIDGKLWIVTPDPSAPGGVRFDPAPPEVQSTKPGTRINWPTADGKTMTGIIAEDGTITGQTELPKSGRPPPQGTTQLRPTPGGGEEAVTVVPNPADPSKPTISTQETKPSPEGGVLTGSRYDDKTGKTMGTFRMPDGTHQVREIPQEGQADKPARAAGPKFTPQAGAAHLTEYWDYLESEVQRGSISQAEANDLMTTRTSMVKVVLESQAAEERSAREAQQMEVTQRNTDVQATSNRLSQATAIYRQVESDYPVTLGRYGARGETLVAAREAALARAKAYAEGFGGMQEHPRVGPPSPTGYHPIPGSAPPGGVEATPRGAQPGGPAANITIVNTPPQPTQWAPERAAPAGTSPVINPAGLAGMAGMQAPGADTAPTPNVAAGMGEPGALSYSSPAARPDPTTPVNEPPGYDPSPLNEILAMAGLSEEAIAAGSGGIGGGAIW